MRNFAIIIIWVSLVSMRRSLGQEKCGELAVGALCPEGQCCSQWGWCGSIPCNCSSSTPPRPDLGSLIPQELFDRLIPHRNEPRCPAAGFYTYEAFLSAAACFPEFAAVGDTDTRNRETAAFFGQTSAQTTGGPPGDYAWGYCYNESTNPHPDCDPSIEYPCVPGKKYYGRGPIQISYNYNYGAAGSAIGYDLLSDPDAVARDPVLSFETAFWFWMTPQGSRPSCHDVITGKWTPSDQDIQDGRLPGYGVITNIITGGTVCGHGPDESAAIRVEFYKRSCDILEVSTGDNLDCDSQKPFGNSVLSYIAMKLDNSS